MSSQERAIEEAQIFPHLYPCKAKRFGIVRTQNDPSIGFILDFGCHDDRSCRRRRESQGIHEQLQSDSEPTTPNDHSCHMIGAPGYCMHIHGICVLVCTVVSSTCMVIVKTQEEGYGQ